MAVTGCEFNRYGCHQWRLWINLRPSRAKKNVWNATTPAEVGAAEGSPERQISAFFAGNGGVVFAHDEMSHIAKGTFYVMWSCGWVGLWLGFGRLSFRRFHPSRFEFFLQRNSDRRLLRFPFGHLIRQTDFFYEFSHWVFLSIFMFVPHMVLDYSI